MGRGTTSCNWVFAVVAAVLASATLISVVTGTYGHWPFVLAGTFVGLWAVQSASK